MDKVEQAYQWLLANPNKSMLQAAKHYNLWETSLSKELKARYGYDAKKAHDERYRANFERACVAWPSILKELETTEDRALDIIRRHGFGQGTLNNLVAHFDYDIGARANRLRQHHREQTLMRTGKIKGKYKQEKSSIEGARYMALCMPWGNVA